MSTHQTTRLQGGNTFIELAVYMAIIVPTMIGLGTTIKVFDDSASSSRHVTQASMQNKKILELIAAELIGTSTKRDHPDVGTPETPQPEAGAATVVNTAYNYPPTPSGDMQNTTSRDGSEFWHPATSVRRLYIYGTYQMFDTVEYQKVRTPLDSAQMSSFISGTNQVNQPWSTRRKIFLENGKAILLVHALSGGSQSFRRVVLGTHVERLRFHLNRDGHVIIQLTTVSGTPPGSGSAAGPESVHGARITNQMIVAPRNALS